jgi:hypothetical protein
MYDLLRAELEKDGVFDGQLPQIIKDLANANNNYKVPYRLKLGIAVSEFILFFSQFQKKIKLGADNLIPINSITFTMAPSGIGKDSTKDAIRNCFGQGYMAINTKRKANAKQKAIEAAREEGLENPDQFDVYKKYYTSPSPLFAAPNSTIEGLTLDFNRLEEEGLGAGSIYTGEIADEMARGMADTMQFLSEVYDTGSKEVKALRNKENQLKPIENLPVSALLQGSPLGILYENYVKDAFKKAFGSKLARRSFFIYTPEEGIRPNFKQIEVFDEWVINNKIIAKESKQKALIAINSTTERLLNEISSTIDVSPEVSKIYDRYSAYNEEVANKLDHHYQISKLVRQHLQWKALKFAGAIALFNGHDTIMKEDYIAAVGYCEELDNDMQAFETELAKQPHEVFAGLMNNSADQDGKASMSFHNIKKSGFINATGNTEMHIKNLIQLAASYDKAGIYTLCDDGVCFERQVLTDIVGVSYLEVDNTNLMLAVSSGASEEKIDLEKHKVAATTTYGYGHMETSFEDLGKMLEEDFAYTPFRLKQADTDAVYDEDKHKKAKGGVRGKDNVIGGCKWIVIDVDKSTITAEECHLMLSDINHHIALTSNKDNPNKFRVLVELDSIVDISDKHWKAFIQHISEYLAVIADPLPKSQIFFSYSDRKVLSVTDADPLETKPFIIKAAETVGSKERPKKISRAQGQTQMNDPLTTFEYAYEAADGEGSRSMIRAALHAVDLGATKEEVVDLMEDIQDYWAYPMGRERFERTILTYVERLF